MLNRIGAESFICFSTMYFLHTTILRFLSNKIQIFGILVISCYWLYVITWVGQFVK